MENSKRKDPLTGEEFTPTKETQIFATPANRIKFNNHKANKERKEINIKNKPFQTNYSILAELFTIDKNAVYSRDFLLGKGYNFHYITHLTNYEGTDYPSIYEFIVVISGLQIKIIKNDRCNNN